MLAQQSASGPDDMVQAAQGKAGIPGPANHPDGPDGAAGRMREVYAALAAGNLASLHALLAPDASGYEYRNMQPFAHYHGRQAIVARLTALMPSLWDEFSFELHTAVGYGSLTLALATWHGTSTMTCTSYLCRHVLVMRSDTSGQITAVWISWDDPIESHEAPPPDWLYMSPETS